MVITNSILALFRVEFTGRGELADRQQKLGKVSSNYALDTINVALGAHNIFVLLLQSLY